MEKDVEKSLYTSNRLNFIIAICAMLVSVASFYATYLQANSAEQQVKAMTYPLIEYSSGNYDVDKKEAILSLNLTNSGVGPAIIKDVVFKYQGKGYANINAFLKACCMQEFNSFVNNKNRFPIEMQMITSRASNIILPINESVTLLSLHQHELNLPFWKKLNTERFKLSISACYCSLLDSCYQTEFVGKVEEVEFCPKRDEKVNSLSD